MKILFSLLALVLFAGLARAANPSFGAFDANFFQVTGTGNNSIKIKTNAFTWLNAGGGDSVWTNVAGTIQPVSTNAIKIFPSGRTSIGLTNYLFSDIGLSISGSNPIGGNEQLGVDIVHLIGGTNGAQATLSTYVDSSPYRQASLDLQAGPSLNNRASLDAGEDFVQMQAFFNNVQVFSLEPTAADGTTPYTFDTSVFQTSGYLHLWNNLGTNKAGVTHSGHIISPSILFTNSAGEISLTPTNQSVVVLINRSNAVTFEVSSGLGAANTVAQLELTLGPSAVDLFLDTQDGGDVTGFYQWAYPGSSGLWVRDRGSIVVDVSPFAADGTTPYTFDTVSNHTSGDLLKWQNAGLTHFSLASTNGIATPAIAYGATSQPWQFGSASNVTSVAFPGFTATNIIEVAINGVAYYIPAKIK